MGSSRPRERRFAALLGAAVLIAVAGATFAASPISVQASGLSVRIVGNHFVDGTGRTVRLLGVNRSGSEYACMANWAVFDGPSDAASIAAMASWKINAVREPLNEDCWLGINGAPPALSGAGYHDAIAGYVSRLHAAGMVAIVDLHWNAQGSLPADGKTGQGRKMADLDHAPSFWTSVATFFTNDPGVVFDLFNEPHDIDWDCWLHGCAISDGTGTWQAAGMQTLLDAVRSTGATNVVTASSNGWGGDIAQWRNYKPKDPLGQIAPGWHVYYPETYYSAPSLWDTAVAPIAQELPIVTTEFGQHDCAGGWMNQFLPWADQHGLSYTAWTWDTWPDCSNPVLITNYDGTPTGYGASLRDHLRSLNGINLASRPNAAQATTIKQSTHAAATPPAVVVTRAPVISHHRVDPPPTIAVATRAVVRPPAPLSLIVLILVVFVAEPMVLAAGLWWFRRRKRRNATAVEALPERVSA